MLLDREVPRPQKHQNILLRAQVDLLIPADFLLGGAGQQRRGAEEEQDDSLLELVRRIKRFSILKVYN
jgi:hypothetical protein